MTLSLEPVAKVRESSLKLTDMTEPTLVVAMATALASVGAAMLEKLTEENTTGADEPPQAVWLIPTPAKAADSGSKGTPESACKMERRERLEVFDMGTLN
jgi:hypothetical protein